MYYYLSIIALALLPSGEPLLESAVTGPFIEMKHCSDYKEFIEQVAEKSPMSEIIKSECKKREQGKAV
jgi:hypothetical protein|tara:strand:+ start:178 stop:381 length:204 start_codon:yes stop_codon:yes gene_type:complete